MTHDGRPVLSDFGISRLLINSKTFAGTTSIKGNTRWMAPELIEETASKSHTKSSDVWAFGMVLYVCTRSISIEGFVNVIQEALSGEAPYHTMQNEAQVVISIINDKLPAKPEVSRESGTHFEMLWGCCLICWRKDPKARPPMAKVRELLDVGRQQVIATSLDYKNGRTKLLNL